MAKQISEGTNDVLPVVSLSQARLESTEDAKELLARLLGFALYDCEPMESYVNDEGTQLHFTNMADGKGYTLEYAYETFDEGVVTFARLVFVKISRAEQWDCKPRNYPCYRLVFHYGAAEHLQALELAWLLSKHGIEVTGKADTTPMLFVTAESREDLCEFVRDVRASFHGPVFRAVEGSTKHGYVDIDVDWRRLRSRDSASHSSTPAQQ